jgi:hypothetical protein
MKQIYPDGGDWLALSPNPRMGIEANREDGRQQSRFFSTPLPILPCCSVPGFLRSILSSVVPAAGFCCWRLAWLEMKKMAAQ